jgi:VanZ family protein
MKNKKLTIYRVIFICWSVIILTLTSIPKLQSPASDIFEVDKLAHFGVYFVFAYLLVRISRRDERGVIKILILSALIIPVLDELHQIPIPGREFCIFDMIADMAGFAAAIFLLKIKLIQPIRN